MSHYLLRENGRERGPLTLGQVRSLWNSAQIPATAEYRLESAEVWQPLEPLMEPRQVTWGPRLVLELNLPPSGVTLRLTPRDATQPVSGSLNGCAPPPEISGAEPPMPIPPNFTFENFIVGPETELAHKAASAVAAAPGLAYNPLLILGDTGLGKTHLLHAIAHRMRHDNPRLRILCIPCEAFAEEYLHAVRAPADGDRYAKINDFKRKYREVDALLIDDIQFLAGKVGTQEEFFAILNHLQLNHKQVILTGDRPVKEILSERLVSRLQGGITVHVSTPGLRTRMALIEAKAHSVGMTLPAEVVEFVASRITGHGRELQGAIHRIAVFMALRADSPLTIPSLNLMLGDMLAAESERLR